MGKDHTIPYIVFYEVSQTVCRVVNPAEQKSPLPCFNREQSGRIDKRLAAVVITHRSRCCIK